MKSPTRHRRPLRCPDCKGEQVLPVEGARVVCLGRGPVVDVRCPCGKRWRTSSEIAIRRADEAWLRRGAA